jgi:hypothetical protein
MPRGRGRGGKRTERSSVATQNHAMRRLEGWAVDARHACQLVGGVVPPNSSAPRAQRGAVCLAGLGRNATLDLGSAAARQPRTHFTTSSRERHSPTELDATHATWTLDILCLTSAPAPRSSVGLPCTEGELVQPLPPARFARLGCRDAHSMRLLASEPLGHTLQHVGTSGSP